MYIIYPRPPHFSTYSPHPESSSAMSCSPAQTAYPGSARTHRSNPALQRALPSPRSSSRPSVSHTPRPSGTPYSRESPPTSQPARSATISAFPSILPLLLRAYAILPRHVNVRLQRFRRVFVEKQHVIIARSHSASPAFHRILREFPARRQRLVQQEAVLPERLRKGVSERVQLVLRRLETPVEQQKQRDSALLRSSIVETEVPHSGEDGRTRAAARRRRWERAATAS